MYIQLKKSWLFEILTINEKFIKRTNLILPVAIVGAELLTRRRFLLFDLKEIKLIIFSKGMCVAH